jgi:hypothetical protein
METPQDNEHQIIDAILQLGEVFTADSSQLTISFTCIADHRAQVVLENIRNDKVSELRLEVHKILTRYGAYGMSVVAAPGGKDKTPDFDIH